MNFKWSPCSIKKDFDKAQQDTMGTKKSSFNQTSNSLSMSSYTTNSSRPTFVDMRIN